MKQKSLFNPMEPVLLFTALLGGVTLVAILTNYPGLIELKLGNGWGQVTIDGRSTSERPGLPSQVEN
jgi:hypothetical protein